MQNLKICKIQIQGLSSIFSVFKHFQELEFLIQNSSIFKDFSSTLWTLHNSHTWPTDSNAYTAISCCCFMHPGQSATSRHFSTVSTDFLKKRLKPSQFPIPISCSLQLRLCSRPSCLRA